MAEPALQFLAFNLLLIEIRIVALLGVLANAAANIWNGPYRQSML